MTVLLGIVSLGLAQMLWSSDVSLASIPVYLHQHLLVKACNPTNSRGFA